MDNANSGANGGEPAVPSDATAGGPAGRPPGPDNQTKALVAFTAVALVLLLVGLIVWLANRDGDDITSDTLATTPATDSTAAPPTSATDTTAVATTADPTTTTTTTSTIASTTTTTTTTSTTAPTTTAPPEFALPEPGASTWTVALHTGDQITLALAATDGDVTVYDGVAEPLRCAAVVGPGEALTAWCGEPGVATTFVADRGLEPIAVELGDATGNVTLRRQAAGWTAAANGCSAPVTTLLGALDPGGHPVTGVVCAGDEAFVGFGSALFGPNLAPDGGGALLTLGDEGWNLVDMGTSVPCDGGPDDVDRCALFGVETDLFEALLPIPSAFLTGGTDVDVVDVADRTAEVAEWIAGETDPDAIGSILVDRLDDPGAEAPAEVRIADELRPGRIALVVVQIPQFDDAFLAETWAVWVPAPDATGTFRAVSWSTCARGVTGDGLCV